MTIGKSYKIESYKEWYDDGSDDGREVPAYRPRIGYSMQDVAKELGVTLLTLKNSGESLRAGKVVGCVVDAGQKAWF